MASASKLLYANDDVRISRVVGLDSDEIIIGNGIEFFSMPFQEFKRIINFFSANPISSIGSKDG